MNDTHVIVLWYHGAKGRPFETLTDPQTHKPLAYSLNYLQEHHFKLFHAATYVKTAHELESWTNSVLFPTVTKNSPLLVPTNLAREQFGWSDFSYTGE